MIENLATAAADDVATAVHELAYATRDALIHPSDVYEVLAALHLAAGQLPQSCRQMRDFLRRELDRGYLVTDDAGDRRLILPAEAVGDAVMFLERAEHLAEELRQALSAAQTATATLAHREQAGAL